MAIRRSFLIMLAITVLCNIVDGSDWSQWHGPKRDNISPDKNLLKEWPKGGPKLIWTVEGIGAGYSTVSKIGDSIYITGTVNKKGMLNKIGLDGKLAWQKPYASEWTRSYGGARSTPTIDGPNAYLMSGLGEVVCIDRENGQVKWSLNTFKKYKGRAPYWGVAESILICEDKLFCMAGGKNASIVALDKLSGKEAWTTKDLSEGVAYCSAILVEHHGKKQIVTSLPDSVVGIDVENGNLLWSSPVAPLMSPDAERRGKGSTAATPIYRDGCVFVSTGYHFGGAKIRISEDSSKATVVWKNFDLDNHHGGVLLIGDYLYGTGWTSNTKGDWFCVDWETGKTVYSYNWDDNKGSISYADGMLYCYCEKAGEVALVKADPKGFDIISSFEITKGEDEHWAHPVILDGVLYIRHGDCLMAYDVSSN